MRIDAASGLVLVPNVHARRFDNELVILHLEKGVYFGLDAVGTAIWEALVAGNTVGEAVNAILTKYDVSEEQAMADACALVSQLTEAGIAVVRSPSQEDK